MTMINLPDIQLVDDNVTQTLNNMITVYEATAQRQLFPGDPVRLFLLSMAQIVVQQRTLINLTGKQALLRYASDTVLDHMGAFWETTRLPASAARTTIRFTLSAPQASTVIIPAGTRVSAPGNVQHFFSTIAVANIEPGQTQKDIPSISLETGTGGNGFLVGHINQIVDPIAFVASAVNVTESAGGAAREDDEAYRLRIYTAPESFSVAGPDGAYRYWAKSASPAIVDVSVTSPAAGEVLVIPLLEGGEVPNQDILDAVATILSDRKVRPLTDSVSVIAPVEEPYSIELTYWISRDQAPEATAIQAAVTAAISAYVVWQKSRLGRDVNPSELIRRIMVAGAHRVNIISPTFDTINYDSIAVAGPPIVTYGGLTDD